MDPLGIVVVIGAYFANKFWTLELTADDVLLASIGFGAARTLWERSKRKKSQVKEVKPSE